MRPRSSFLLLLGVLILSVNPALASRDVVAVTLEPLPSTRVNIGSGNPVSITIKNEGTETLDTVGLRMTMTGLNGVIYDDSVNVYHLAAGATMKVVLEDLMVQNNDPFEMLATASIWGDEEIWDNSIHIDHGSSFLSRDISALGVVSPSPDGEVPQKLGFRPQGKFMSYWFVENNEPVRVQIRRCSDNALVFRADTTLFYLPGKSQQVTQYFPSAQDGWDTRSLPVGCYTIAVIARKPTDGDRTNDTAYASFTITPYKLSYDVAADTGSGPKSSMPFPLNSAIPIQASYTNIGTVEVNNVKVYAIIQTENESVIYRDSAVIANWPVGQSISKTFKPFTSSQTAQYRLVSYTTLSTDQDHYDDTVHRKFSVADVSSFGVVKVATPQEGNFILLGALFNPIARYRWVGNLPVQPTATARMSFYNLDQPYESFVEAPIKGLSSSTPETDVLFDPIWNGSELICTLPIGHYLAVASIVNSQARPDTVRFYVGVHHNIRVDSIISPLPRSYSSLPMHVAFRLANLGLYKETNVECDVIIRNVYDSVIYDEKVYAPVDLNGKVELTFPDLVATTKGMHRVTVSANLPGDGDQSDNLLDYLFHFGPNLDDIALTEPRSPMPGQVIKQGTEFKLEALAEWFGWEVFGNISEAEVSVVDCNTNEQVFGSKATVNVPKREVISLPTFYDGVSVTEVPAGCYRAIFTISHVNDLDLSDNRLEVPFEIQMSSGVSNANGEFKCHLQLSSAKLELRMSESVTGRWNIRDGLGKMLGSGLIEGAAIDQLPVDLLPSGSYYFELLNAQGALLWRDSFHLVK